MTQDQGKPPLVPTNVVLFVGLPLIALIAVPTWGFYVGYAGWQWFLAVVFLYLNGLSIRESSTSARIAAALE